MCSGARVRFLVAARRAADAADARIAYRCYVRAGYGNTPLSVSGLSALGVRMCASMFESCFPPLVPYLFILLSIKKVF